MSATAPITPPRTTTTVLVYWFLIICGLVGLTMQGIDSPTLDWIDLPGALLPIWVGSVLGVAFGQLLGWLRIRIWVAAIMAFGAVSSMPFAYYFLFDMIGRGLQPTVIALIPAIVCGYLSLSERGALAAFWYPAVLWMLVILGAQAPGSFDEGVALPFAVGLAALFVVFLRARESRRVAIWHSFASVAIAPQRSRTVLRASPFRANGQHAFTGLVGAAAFVLAAWIAPHMWKKDQTQHPSVTTASATSLGATADANAAPVCCDAPNVEDKRERVREYFTPLNDQDKEKPKPAPVACVPCPNKSEVAIGDGIYGRPYVGYPTPKSRYEGGPYAGGAYASNGTSYSGGNDWSAYNSGASNSGPSNAGAYNPGWYGGTNVNTTPANNPAYSWTPEPPPPPPPPVEPPVKVKPKAAKTKTVAPVVAPIPHPAEPAPIPVAAPMPLPPAPPVVRPPPVPAPPPIPAKAPNPPSRLPQAPLWHWALVLAVIGLVVPGFTRAVRRGLTLRHLARPFWSETIDQQISNHWQRMLIGLRDAGIHPKTDEQPLAFAKRVGIEGMHTCATILERVRHGVRVESSDLDTMGSAAGVVYSSARKKAGAAGRVSSWIRWPLL